MCRKEEELEEDRSKETGEERGREGDGEAGKGELRRRKETVRKIVQEEHV